MKECDFQEKPKGTLPHFSLLLPVAVELPQYYVRAFYEIGSSANLALIANKVKSIFLRLFEIGLNLTRVIKNSQCRMKMKYWKIQKWHEVML